MLSKDDGEEEETGKERLKTTRLGRVAVRHMLRPATILSLQSFLLQIPEFTHFDLLVAAACTDDCEPMLPVDFERIEMLADRLSECQSQLFLRSSADWRRIIPKRGKRLLSALKIAVVLLQRTASDVESVAEEHDCYAFDLFRLSESMDRLLLASAAIESLIHAFLQRSIGG